ncbi:MAG: hypothetical protein PHE68_04695 [Candidatus Peribacteraceae bacterium]|nr:hypothetical protein [Candidatus Peribacteraceae bacterium]MDD5075094.1 hypothetical protein [Candidatus Peribacteraceae bacterium]
MRCAFLLVSLLFSSVLFSAEPKPSSVTMTGPVTLALPPTVDPSRIATIDNRLSSMEGRLANLEKGQNEMNRKLDLLLGRIDGFLSKQTEKISLKEEREQALKEGAFIPCPDGIVRQFWRDPQTGRLLVGMKFGDEYRWCPVQVMTTYNGTGWYALYGNNWERLMFDSQPVVKELDRLFPAYTSST